jgi:CubicO group peptidase (beta-lactamase class C family)
MRLRDQRTLQAALNVVAGTKFGAMVLRCGHITATAFGGGLNADSRFELGSIRKSVFSTLLGHALAESRGELEANAADLWPGLLSLGSAKDRATTRHQLARGVSDWLAPGTPGLKFVYNTAAKRVLASALGLPGRELAPFACEHVQARLGLDSWNMDHWTLGFDAQRFETQGPKLTIWSHLSDLARWGRDWIEGGSGPGGIVVPADHIERATRRANPQLAALMRDLVDA